MSRAQCKSRILSLKEEKKKLQAELGLSATTTVAEEEPIQISTEVLCNVQAIYPYEATCPEEMSIAVGDVIEVFSMDDTGWYVVVILVVILVYFLIAIFITRWYGQKDGCGGLFPSSYVNKI